MGRVMWRIEFEKMPWKEISSGVREKTHRGDSKQLRLVEFAAGFRETDWCERPHLGLVLEGEFTLEFRHRTERFAAGDGIFIGGSGEGRHRIAVGVGRALLILAEDI